MANVGTGLAAGMAAGKQAAQTQKGAKAKFGAQQGAGPEFPYVVAGAKIYCDEGTHFRRLDLPKCHGVYIRDKAATHEEDSVHPDNIPIFGVCRSAMNANEAVQYDNPYNPDLLPFGEGMSFPILGKRCEPKVGKWLDAKEDTLVDGIAALTVECTLACCYGGIIGFVTDGQEVE